MLPCFCWEGKVEIEGTAGWCGAATVHQPVLPAVMVLLLSNNVSRASEVWWLHVVVNTDSVHQLPTGLLMVGRDAPDITPYFVPSLGPAPGWAAFLEGLTEELEEADAPTVYDDYRCHSTH